LTINNYICYKLSNYSEIVMLSDIASIHSGTRYRVKDWEKARIYQEICAKPGSSRKFISEKFKMRPTTVSFAVQELIHDRLVREGRTRITGKPGRPELRLLPNLDRCLVISIYVQSRQLRGVLVNMGDQVLAEQTRLIEEQTENAAFLDTCLSIVEHLSAGIPAGSELLGVGLSLVGTINPRTKLLSFAARWPRIRGLDFHELEQRAKLPVALNRIHESELQYLIEKNKAYKRDNIVLFHWGFGIGISYSYMGQLLVSSTGEFGEIGHTIIDPDSQKRCQCGRFGCLETEAALWALLPEIRESNPDLKEHEEEYFELLQQPEVAQLPALSRALRFVTLGVVNVQRLLCPDRILFVGPFTENAEIFRRLKEGFEDSLFESERGHVRLEIVRGGFSGCSFGSSYPFFRARLKELLVTRYH
jgi:predicted NBD/HSP70 family sugar kinase